MLPVRGATSAPCALPGMRSFQSMLPVRGATAVLSAQRLGPNISIHAPRAGSDVGFVVPTFSEVGISIHAPRAGSDCPGTITHRGMATFQSMLPVRGATGAEHDHAGCCNYFNPCSPCGERLQAVQGVLVLVQFQSMLPVRGATAKLAKIRVAFWQNSRSFR